MRIYLINVLAFVILLAAYYLLAFLSGYGSKAGYVQEEKELLIKFLLFHLAVNFYVLYRTKHLRAISIIGSVVFIVLLYILAAYKFGLFQ